MGCGVSTTNSPTNLRARVGLPDIPIAPSSPDILRNTFVPERVVLRRSFGIDCGIITKLIHDLYPFHLTGVIVKARSATVGRLYRYGDEDVTDWTVFPPEKQQISNDNAQNINQLEVEGVQLQFLAIATVSTVKRFVAGLCVGDIQAKNRMNTSGLNLLQNLADTVLYEAISDKEAWLDPTVLCDTSVPNWPIKWVSRRWKNLTDLPSSAQIGFWECFVDPEQEDVSQPYFDQVQGQRCFTRTIVFRSNFMSWFTVQFEPASSDARTTGAFGDLYFGRVCAAKICDDGPISEASSEVLDTDIFKDIQIGAYLGKGGFGSVYRVIYNGEELALKIIDDLRTFSLPDGDKEALVGEKLRHPNLVRTVAHGKSFDEERKARFWMLMELCPNGSLLSSIEKGVFRNMTALYQTAIEICAGMAYLHENALVHGDLNGNNVLLDGAMVAKIADFGLTRKYDGTARTQTYGTVSHMPPELLQNGLLSQLGDVYAFGVILYELCTMQRPWANLRPAQIIGDKVKNSGQLLIPSTVPIEVNSLIRDCMMSEYQRRPSFASLEERIRGLQQSEVARGAESR